MESAASNTTKVAEERSANGPERLSFISRRLGLGKSRRPCEPAPDPRRLEQEHEFRLFACQRLDASRDPPDTAEV